MSDVFEQFDAVLRAGDAQTLAETLFTTLQIAPDGAVACQVDEGVAVAALVDENSAGKAAELFRGCPAVAWAYAYQGDPFDCEGEQRDSWIAAAHMT